MVFFGDRLNKNDFLAQVFFSEKKIDFTTVLKSENQISVV